MAVTVPQWLLYISVFFGGVLTEYTKRNPQPDWFQRGCSMQSERALPAARESATTQAQNNVTDRSVSLGSWFTLHRQITSLVCRIFTYGDIILE